jgi:DNA-binding NarL/FixJ family response regulator
VLSLVAAGCSNDHIAERLAVTTRTVETHSSRTFTKLGPEPSPAVHGRVLATLAHLGATV